MKPASSSNYAKCRTPFVTLAVRTFKLAPRDMFPGHLPLHGRVCWCVSSGASRWPGQEPGGQMETDGGATGVSHFSGATQSTIEH